MSLPSGSSFVPSQPRALEELEPRRVIVLVVGVGVMVGPHAFKHAAQQGAALVRQGPVAALWHVVRSVRRLAAG